MPSLESTMRPFSYERATDIASTIDALQASPETMLLAGGTTLLDLMKLDVMTPHRLIDITALVNVDPTLDDVRTTANGGIAIGALARMSAVAAHPRVRSDYPVVAEALEKGASAQLRNMATIGGNLLQRTRCVYFRDVTVPECNKRDPGSGCAARRGVNRNSAVLGTSESCIATHASDLAVALVALDAVVHLEGATGERRFGINDFFLLPGSSPQRETALMPGELITAVTLPRLPAGTRSHYLKVRDRESYEFALTSAAVAIQLVDGVINSAHIALGGVATKPWPAPEAERMLIGSSPSGDLFAEASAAALDGAEPLAQNAFKVALARRTLERALVTVTRDGIDMREC
jgi:xanthine dehydrogenase YagS FAD-binding subunit